MFRLDRGRANGRSFLCRNLHKKSCAQRFSQLRVTIRAAPGLGFDLGERVAGSQRVRTLLLSPRCGDCRPEEIRCDNISSIPVLLGGLFTVSTKNDQKPARATDGRRACD